MDLPGRMGHAEAQVVPPLAAGSTTLLPPSPREWLADDHQVYFLLDLVDELDLSEILIPAQAKDPCGEHLFRGRAPSGD
jgi:hypothetical protein